MSYKDFSNCTQNSQDYIRDDFILATLFFDRAGKKINNVKLQNTES